MIRVSGQGCYCDRTALANCRFDGGRRDRRHLPRAKPRCITGRIPMPDIRGPDRRSAQRRQKARHQSGKEDRGAGEGIGQAAGTADHRDLDRQAKPEDLRRQRLLRGNADFHRHEAAIRRRWAFSASSRNRSCTIPTSIAARRCPIMQRITWSGIAMHAGVLPGYPASHGCIRMPMAFAMKMWNWTKMGARVVVTPGEMTPCQLFASAAGQRRRSRRSRRPRAASGCAAGRESPTRRPTPTRRPSPRFRRRALN